MSNDIKTKGTPTIGLIGATLGFSLVSQRLLHSVQLRDFSSRYFLLDVISLFIPLEIS
jgi:hypothetical protein